jgi:DNA transformation protein and related proteins
MRRQRASDLAGQVNLGATIRARLQDADIRSMAQLRLLGAARAYKELCVRAGRRLPVCYYLYSLEGALRGVRWDKLPEGDKARLLNEVGLSKQAR